MSDLFYRAGPLPISLLVALLLLFAEEVGFRLGRLGVQEKERVQKEDVSLVLGGIITLLSLMLGFTFALSESRYESRRELVIDESNAIGTTYLRSQTLPEPVASDVRNLLRKYLALRLEMAKNFVITPEKLGEYADRTRQIHDALWAEASSAAKANQTPVMALFLQSLNQMIDISSQRLAAFRHRVPLSIYAAIFLVSVVAMWLVGYYFRVRRGSPGLPALMFALLIALVMWLIMDLDQPLKGTIRPSQQAFEDLERELY